MNKKSTVGLPVLASLLFLSACGGAHDQGSGGAPTATAPQAAAPPVREMQPLQAGQPAQKQPLSSFSGQVIPGGNPGTTTIPFGQAFKLGDLQYQFGAARGKGFVGLEANPAMKPAAGNSYFLVRYLVVNNGGSSVTVPNNAAVHLMNGTTKQVLDIDQAATNANVQSGAATGLPDQLVLDPGVANMQSLAFEIPASVDVSQLDILVTDPKEPTKLFQLVKLAN
ncbi:MAG: hypothetical protein KGS72_18205 [Cyanobacteria bacterium REEB67]|nr:hypothetical protein [Cyanobacteria bacterium REEB67]